MVENSVVQHVTAKWQDRDMAELSVHVLPGGSSSPTVEVINDGPETVVLNAIEYADPNSRFFVGDPLHRDDLELRPGQAHEFMIALSLADRNPVEVQISFTDGSGSRTKTYPIYA